MQFATLKSGDLAAVQNDTFVIFGTSLADAGLLPRGATMLDFIARYPEIADDTAVAIEQGERLRADASLLAPPLQGVSKIWAAARNYPREGRPSGEGLQPAGAASETLMEVLEMAFLKPPSAIIGPEDAIVLPNGAGNVFPEVELCVVIGKTCRKVPRETAEGYVFGYTMMLDVTARAFGSGMDVGYTRCVRKAFDTFAPIGPWITTRDALPDPQDLEMQLWLNGELRYTARSNSMLNGVAELVSYFSQISTLLPGDLISTGNPNAAASQHQLTPGDDLRARIEGIGDMSLRVRSPESVGTRLEASSPDSR